MSMQRQLAWKQIELTYEASVAHQFARYALALDYPAIPACVVKEAKRAVIDALGCAIGAFDAPGRLICEETAREIGGAEEATVFCSGMRTSAMNASLVNSFLVRFLDYNDFGGGGHNSDALPSILAVAEKAKATGKDFLTSLVISYELGARFRDSISRTIAQDEALVSPDTGRKRPLLPASPLAELAQMKSLEDKGWPSDIRGGLNQPPAIGKLMGLDERQIANAIGICMTHALPIGVLDGHRDECTMAKNLRFGWVGHDAILACMLARRGFTGPVRVIEADTGIRNVIAQGEMDLERLTDFSGWRMLETRYKTMPTNGPTATHTAATLSIVVENDLKPDDISSVLITTSVRESRHTTTPAKKYPRNAESADHSAFYSNALAIKERAFGPDSIDPGKFTDPVVLDLIEKIAVAADPTFHSYQGASEIITKDGRRFRKQIDVPHGLGDVPHTDAELEQKFRRMAQKHMSGARADELLETCWALDEVEDIGRLARLMVFEG